MRWQQLLCALAFSAAWSTVLAQGFSVKDMAGTTHEAADYQGRWLLVNFWATWCPPCLEEIPDLIALHEQRKDVSVIGISVDAAPESTIRRFADENLMAYPVVLSNDSVVKQFGRISVVPSTYIYNPQGELVRIHRGLISRQVVEKLIAGH